MDTEQQYVTMLPVMDATLPGLHEVGTLPTSSGSGQSRMVIVRKHFGLHPKWMHHNRSKISHNYSIQ